MAGTFRQLLDGINAVSPTFASAVENGVTVSAGAEITLATVTGRTRSKIRVMHRGNPALAPGDPTDVSGAVTVGWGATAPDSLSGDFLLLLDVVEEKFPGAVHVRNTGATPVRVVWTEWFT